MIFRFLSIVEQNNYNFMRSILIAGFVIFFIHNSSAQFMKALTDKGDEVILYTNGTWKYVNDSSVAKPKEIPVNNTKFTKSQQSNFLVKSDKLKVGVWINPKKWKFTKEVSNDAAEYEFNSLKEDMYGMIITERIELPYETLKNAAFENAKNVAPDIEITKEEFRMVNGSKVLLLQMKGTYQGINVVYFGYYLSNSLGSVQFLTYTTKNLFDEYSNEMEELLNGLIEVQ